MGAGTFNFASPTLRSFRLGTDDIQFDFGEQHVSFLSPFELTKTGKATALIFDPGKRTGELLALWDLLGTDAEYYEYDRSFFRIWFEGGRLLTCRNTMGHVDVEFMGGDLGGGLEFFRYPEILLHF